MLQFSIQNFNQSNLRSPVETEIVETHQHLDQHRTKSFASDVTESDFSAASIIGDEDDDAVSLATTSSHRSNSQLGIEDEDDEENVDGLFLNFSFFFLLCQFLYLSRMDID